jgi:hypothetical protein
VPKYTYRCNVCNEYSEVYHSISEKLTDCSCGGEGSLIRVPSLPFRVSEKSTNKPGQLTREFIKDAKKEIEDYKRDIIKGIEDE